MTAPGVRSPRADACPRWKLHRLGASAPAACSRPEPEAPVTKGPWLSIVGTVKVVVDVEAAAALAETRLAQALPRRWRHVRAVAQRARSVADTLSLPDDLVAAAWLHDIGYAPELAETGFHPLDGARFLRRAGVDGQVVSLVAYHSCAQIEADVRGLGAELAAEFTPAGPLLSDALLYCDMTTGPDGDYVRPADRLGEIRERYGPGHAVTKFVELAASEILITAERVAALLTAQAG